MKHTKHAAPESNTSKKFDQRILIHLFFIAVIIVAGIWAYMGLEEKPVEFALKPKEVQETVTAMNHTMGMGNMHTMASTSNPLSVKSNDEAVRKYLDAAQIIAEIYRFNNNGVYGGLCEQSDDLYTLEGNSGGILKFIKMVGATEVFCYTGDTDYMIEAKLPQNGMFYCIDEAGIPVEQRESKEGVNSCS